jgi:hypothetical protein
VVKRSAYNEHIGSMAALPPLENMYEIASLSPAGKYLEAATSAICQTLGVSRKEKMYEKLENGHINLI